MKKCVVCRQNPTNDFAIDLYNAKDGEYVKICKDCFKRFLSLDSRIRTNEEKIQAKEFLLKCAEESDSDKVGQKIREMVEKSFILFY